MKYINYNKLTRLKNDVAISLNNSTTFTPTS